MPDSTNSRLRCGLACLLIAILTVTCLLTCLCATGGLAWQMPARSNDQPPSPQITQLPRQPPEASRVPHWMKVAHIARTIDRADVPPPDDEVSRTGLASRQKLGDLSRVVLTVGVEGENRLVPR